MVDGWCSMGGMELHWHGPKDPVDLTVAVPDSIAVEVRYPHGERRTVIVERHQIVVNNDHTMSVVVPYWP